MNNAGWTDGVVQYQGQGLSREVQLKLFQRGVKLSRVPTGGEPSSGYGLAVARGQGAGDIHAWRDLVRE
ncbi:hypothetical protein DNFV4_00877 [Nitrospira tepida]|uniref:Uncharacterized protein n=1 Tax=Nitrospira tepida TaxID=2973512 RepID=A0AA86MWK8_9BACT|nr:hypothetical protein [Nitrospira tepida]CAI4030449.1 hypothetical protein DNFV4_00877 [Nitrospira tepida]